MQNDSIGKRGLLTVRSAPAGALLSLLVLGIMVAGCASVAATPAAQPTAAAVAQAATAAPTPEPAAPEILPAAGATPAAPAAGAAMGGALVNLAQRDNFGKFLVDDKGMTLYLYTKDSPNVSNCYDKCATAWPPLLTDGMPAAGTGVTAALLGTTMRKDGKMQVTYNGNPLYYYVKDQKAGDITGQGVGGVWYVVSPRGSGMTGAQAPAQAPAAGSAASTPAGTAAAGAQAAPATPSGPAMVKVGQNDQLGQFLVDDKGMSLYLYTKDTPNTSNCYDKCAAAWPPLYTNGAPAGGTGIDSSLLGTTIRKDGTTQVTYGGWPLYYWVKDQKPGDTTGQWVGSVWFVISPQGTKISAGQPAATPAPAPPAAAPANDYGKDYSAGRQATPAAAGASAPAKQTVSIDIKNFEFDAKTITVTAGTTVEWENYDSAPHTVTADNGSFDSGNLNEDAKYTFTFTKPGTYAYYCRYHGGPGGRGMAGQIIVK